MNIYNVLWNIHVMSQVRFLEVKRCGAMGWEMVGGVLELGFRGG